MRTILKLFKDWTEKTFLKKADAGFTDDGDFVISGTIYNGSEKASGNRVVTASELVQSDWNTSTSASLSYIKNKPIIPYTASKISMTSEYNTVFNGYVYSETNDSENKLMRNIDLLGKMKPYINLELNDGQWVAAGGKVDGCAVYMSEAGSYNIDNGKSIARITFRGYSYITVYVSSYSQYSNDYTEACALDTPAVRGAGVIKNEKAEYKSHTYYIRDNNEHFVEIIYSKDGSVNENGDAGYFYFSASTADGPTSSAFAEAGESTLSTGDEILAIDTDGAVKRVTSDSISGNQYDVIATAIESGMYDDVLADGDTIYTTESGEVMVI